MLRRARKFIALLITDALICIGALVVRNGNFAALASGLVAAMVAFTAAHTVSDVSNNNSSSGAAGGGE